MNFYMVYMGVGMINMWNLIFTMGILFTLVACSYIEVTGDGHTVNTSAEMNTGSANAVDADVDDGDAK